jgi:hypothetical protein
MAIIDWDPLQNVPLTTGNHRHEHLRRVEAVEVVEVVKVVEAETRAETGTGAGTGAGTFSRRRIMSEQEPAMEKVHRQKSLRGLGLVVKHVERVGVHAGHLLACEDIEMAHEFLHDPCASETYDRVLEVYTDILDTEHTFLSRTMSTAECAEFVKTLTALRAYVSDLLSRFE